MKALIWFLILALIVGGGAYYYLSSQQSSDEEPYVVGVKVIHRSVHGAGIIEGSSVAMRLKFPFAGIIDDIDAKEGRTIKQGDIVARLNSAEADSKIVLETAALKEVTAKRDALKARKNSSLVSNAEWALKQTQEEVRTQEMRLNLLKTPIVATERREQIEAATRNVELFKKVLATAEAELKALKSHPTPDETESAATKLELAKLRNEEAKQKGAGVEAAAAELRHALADFDRIKRGTSAEDLAAANARIDLARTELEQAEILKRRLENPPAPSPAPLAEIANVEKALADAKARESGKREELERLRKDADAAEMASAEASVEAATERLRMLTSMKEGYKLRAPFDALVTRRLAEPGMLLAPFEDVLHIVDFTHKRLRAEFDVMALPALVKNENLKATIKSRAFGKEELSARVIDVGKAGPRRLMLEDPSQPKGGEVVEVLLEIEKPEDAAKLELYEKLVRPGLRAEADIVLESTPKAVICVPNSYVASEKSADGKSIVQYVWKTELNSKTKKIEKPRKKEVKCGMRDEYYVEIKDDSLHAEDLLLKPKAQGH